MREPPVTESSPRPKRKKTAPVSSRSRATPRKDGGFELALRPKLDAKEIGATLRMLRVENGVSAAVLAADMGVRAQNLSRIERGGRKEPMLSTLNLYLRRLGFELVLVARKRHRSALRDADLSEHEAAGA